MFIETVPNRSSPPAVLLRESYRAEDGRTQKRMLANLSKLPDEMIRKIALDRLILSTAKDAPARRYCDLVVAMMVDRLIAPRSKLGFVRAVDEETATTSLGEVLGLGKVKDREAYEALDWLLERQVKIGR